MGFNIDAARYLVSEKSRGVNFGNTLTLGRQAVYMTAPAYAEILRIVGADLTDLIYADDFLSGLGAEKISAMDFSIYEGAGIIHDANEPVSCDLHESFDTLIDGGTLEHVFNFPIAIRNCMEMVKTGGRVILLTPWHNFSGHGFYEFSPELLWSIFSESNGFEIERMMFVADGHWYEVKNPSVIKQRIEIRTQDEILLFATARKTSRKPIFRSWPQQSDYAATWEKANQTHPPLQAQQKPGKSFLKSIPGLSGLRMKWKSHKKKPGSPTPEQQGLHADLSLRSDTSTVESAARENYWFR